MCVSKSAKEEKQKEEEEEGRKKGWESSKCEAIVPATDGTENIKSRPPQLVDGAALAGRLCA